MIDGMNGYLVSLKDVDAIVRAMEKNLDIPKKNAEMARAVRRIAESVYDVHKINLKIRQTIRIEE